MIFFIKDPILILSFILALGGIFTIISLFDDDDDDSDGDGILDTNLRGLKFIKD